MLKKAFLSKKEISEFKEKYGNLQLDTEVISNILQPFYQSKFPQIQTYCDFWWPRDDSRYGIVQVMNLMINSYAKHALKYNFGNYDFSFEGNRRYENYILNFEDSLFIVPAKREIVLKGQIDDSIVDKAIRFEEVFTQMVMSFIIENYIHLESYEKESIEKLKELNIISEDGKIQYSNQNNKSFKI